MILISQVFYDSVSVKQVDVPSFSGSFGILPKHVPTLGKHIVRIIDKLIHLNQINFFISAVLKPGVVTVYENDGKVKKIFVSSGTITINDDSSVQVFKLILIDRNLTFLYKFTIV